MRLHPPQQEITETVSGHKTGSGDQEIFHGADLIFVTAPSYDATTSTRVENPSWRRRSSQSSHVRPKARTSATPRRPITVESVAASCSVNSPSIIARSDQSTN